MLREVIGLEHDQKTLVKASLILYKAQQLKMLSSRKILKLLLFQNKKSIGLKRWKQIYKVYMKQ